MAQHGIGTLGRATAIVSLLPLLLANAASAAGSTIVVPRDQPTIQAAVMAASEGDTVLVEPGTYRESVHIGQGRRGLTIAAAVPTEPPVVLGSGRRRTPAIGIDRVDDVTIRGLVIGGAPEGVHIENARRAVLIKLRIEDTGLGVRIVHGAGHQILVSEIERTRVAQGIRVDAASDVVIADVTITGTRREGVLVRNAPGIKIARTETSTSRTRDGITVLRSANAVVAECSSSGNRRDGIHVEASPSLVLQDDHADHNGVGLRIARCHPFSSVEDLVAQRNQASANRRRDMIVTAPRCGGRRCRTTTTTTRPRTSTTSTTVTTTTTAPTPTSTPTTTSMTTTTGPLAMAHWRLYVRIVQGQSQHDVDVPYRSIQPPLLIGIRPDDVSAFEIGDQVTVTEIQALGGDTLQRFVNAATSYVASHPTDYPDFGGFVAVRWAKRE